MQTNQDLKNAALKALGGNWAQAIVATIVFLLIECCFYGPNTFGEELGFSPYLIYGVTGGFYISAIFLLNPLGVGFVNAFKSLIVTGDNRLANNTFSLGFSNYLHIVGGALLMNVFIFLWSLLLIIPGIIKSYSYAMTPYILVDKPELSANEAIEESMRLMSGHKFDLFYLQLSFIGWFILALLTAGIGFLWLTPYYNSTVASFYLSLKAEDEAKVA